MSSSSWSAEDEKKKDQNKAGHAVAVEEIYPTLYDQSMDEIEDSMEYTGGGNTHDEVYVNRELRIDAHINGTSFVERWLHEKYKDYYTVTLEVKYDDEGNYWYVQSNADIMMCGYWSSERELIWHGMIFDLQGALRKLESGELDPARDRMRNEDNGWLFQPIRYKELWEVDVALYYIIHNIPRTLDEYMGWGTPDNDVIRRFPL